MRTTRPDELHLVQCLGRLACLLRRQVVAYRGYLLPGLTFHMNTMIPTWLIDVVTVGVFFVGFGCGWWQFRHDDRGLKGRQVGAERKRCERYISICALSFP